MSRSGIALLAIFGLTACAGPPDRPRRVILVSIDTLRADHLGAYGYERPTSPALDAFAEQATVFDDAMSASPWTLPSHATLLTGLYPRRHGLKSHERRLPTGIATVAQLFSRAGYRTGAIVNSVNLGPEFGLDRGFQDYRYVEEDVARREPSTEITGQAMEWLRAAGDTPYFLFLHYYDVHSDYASISSYEDAFVRPHEGEADGTTAQLMAFREGTVTLDASDATALIDRYDAGIRQMDDELARLFAFLDEDGGEPLVIVTSDHGEEFFEHGGVLHGQTQYQEVLHVPLMVSGEGVPKNVRVSPAVSLVDVVPTLLELCDIATPGDLDGSSLVTLWSGANDDAEEARVLFSEADHNNVEHDITRSLRRGRYKLHYNRLSRETRLYDLATDRGELEDITSEEPETLSALEETLSAFLAEEQEEAPIRTLSEEEIEKLRSLGYLR